LAESIRLSVYFPPEDVVSVVVNWSLYWLIQTFPFVIAGTLTGWALTGSLGSVNLVYACSLLGASLGVVGALLFLSQDPPNQLIIPLSLLVTVSCVPLISRTQGLNRLCYSVAVMVVVLFTSMKLTTGDALFPFNVDEYKYLAHVNRLTAQEAAERSALFDGLRGRVELYSSPHFHSILSFTSTQSLPFMDIVLKDGVHVGTIPIISRRVQASFLNDTLFALPYRLIKPRRVLILGESGTLHVWSSLLHRPDAIVLVQSDENVIKAIKNHPSRPLEDPTISIHVGDSRSFLETTKTKFDIIQLAEIEGFAAGSSGIGGLRENYLATVEGFGKCLDALTSEGLVCSVRGIQDPPRDNIKILGTWFKALEDRESRKPADHILMARDELSCVVMCAKSPVRGDIGQEFISACRENSWDAEWGPGIKSKDTNQVHKISGPEGSANSWYNEFLARLNMGQNQVFYENWMYEVRPATDDKPFYFDFFRFRSVSELKSLFGPLWPTRSEMGFLVLLVCLALTTAVAGMLIPLALFFISRSGAKIGRGPFLWSASYFASIGAGFMLVEMTLIQMFTRLFGDPVLATGAVLGGILFFSGLGSSIQPFLTQRLGKEGMFSISIVTASLIMAVYLLLNLYSPKAWDLDNVGKIAMALTIMAPLGLFMGSPFPWGLSAVNAKAKELAPLCWAVNCFASVVASPLAIIIAMSLGYRILWVLCSVTYIFVGFQALSARRILK
jgi:hypothetical protein